MNHEEIRKLAEAASIPHRFERKRKAAHDSFVSASSPQTIIALLDEIDALRAQLDEREAKYSEVCIKWHEAVDARNEMEVERDQYQAKYRGMLDEAAKQEPVFWYRPVGSDGLYEGPVHNNSIGGKMMRDAKPSEWKPLFTKTQPADHFANAGKQIATTPEGYKLVPDAIDVHSLEMHGRTYAPNYVAGWNACRAAVLAVAPTDSKTHFADDDTLAYITEVTRQRDVSVAALEKIAKHKRAWHHIAVAAIAEIGTCK